MKLHILQLPKLVAQRRSTAILGMIIIVMLWAGIIMKYFESVDNDQREAERTNQNFAMLFEENVLRSIGEIDKALLYLRRIVETRGASGGYDTIYSLVQSSDVLSEIIVQAAIVDNKGIIRWSNARPRSAPGDQRRRPRAHQGPAQQHRGPALHQQAGDRPRQRPMVGAVHAALPAQATARSAASWSPRSIPAHFTTFYDKFDLGSSGAISLIGSDGVVRASRRQRRRPLCARPGHQRHQAGAAHAGRRRRDLRRRRCRDRRSPPGHRPQGARPSAVGERQRQQERHLQALVGQSAIARDRRHPADAADPRRDGADPADRSEGPAEGRAAAAHAGEHEPGHHAGHQGPADPDHQQPLRRTAGSAGRVHRASAALRPTGRVPGPDCRSPRRGRSADAKRSRRRAPMPAPRRRSSRSANARCRTAA